jgi:hypothetical protein
LLYSNCIRNIKGGWKIVKQWVLKKVTSFEGVAAETAGALTYISLNI